MRTIIHLAAGPAISVLSILVLFAVAELGARVYHWARFGTSLLATSDQLIPQMGPSILDDELGWRATEGYHNARMARDAAGAEYRVQFSQNGYGFRTFGDLSSGRPRILVIGDSMTQAWEVSDDRTYHALLGERLGAEVFAYGVGGYGFLQELMVLERVLPLVRPHLILWQWSHNDLENNSPVLERDDWSNNVPSLRPYLVDGRVEYLAPKPFGNQRVFLGRQSRVLHYLFSNVERILGQYAHLAPRRPQSDPAWLRAVDTSTELARRFREAAGDAPVVAFNASDKIGEVWTDVAGRAGVVFLGNVVGDAIVQATARGEVVLAEDGGHWNERGHEVVAEVLERQLRALPSARGAFRTAPILEILGRET